MNARKLPSGRWQSIVYTGKVDGVKQYITVTEDSRSECLLKAAQAKADAKNKADLKITVGQATEKYIAAKEGVLSPATIAGYKAVIKRYLDNHTFSSCRLDQLTPEKLQAWVSDISAGVAKKTVKNAHGFVTASIRMFMPKADLDVRFPQGKRYEGYVPSTDEVLKILDAAKQYDPRLYRACLLSAFATLRRGEISCLTADDIHGSYIHVDKDMVKDASGEWIVKLPKTESSVRDVPLPQWIIDEMPKKGPLVDYRPDEITKWFGKVLKSTGLPHFRFHDLRKHAVSLMATQGVSMASIKDIGGWSNMQTPQQIYIKALADAHKREMDQYVSYLDKLKTTKL